MPQSYKVVFLTFNKFPNGDAGSVRYIHLSHLLKKNNHQTILVGFGYTPYKEMIFQDGDSFVSLRPNFRKGLLGSVLNHIFQERRLIKYAMSFHNDATHFVIGSPLSRNSVKRLRTISKRKGIKIIYSVMEWYSPNRLQTKFSILSYLGSRRNKLFVKNMKPEDGSVISISSLLHLHFSSKGINSVRIPFVIDSNKFMPALQRPHQKISLIYAGRPGNKDDLNMIFEGLSKVDIKLCSKLKFNVVGLTYKDLEINAKTRSIFHDSTFAKCINFLGNLKYTDVQDLYGSSDFSVLLRPNYERYAQAGFPTKVVESLFNGVPVICNVTSDLEMYLTDGINSLIVEEYSAQSFGKTITRALNMSSEEICAMKSKAYQTAIQKLDISCFQNEIETILK